MRQKILITGGAGYIGDAIVEHLLINDCNVVIVDSLMYGGSYLRGIEDTRLHFYKQDITKVHEFKDILDRHKPDVICHLAAIVGDGACQVNPTRTVEVNEEATKHIVDYCKWTGARLVFASTCSVYGANNDILNEESPTNPLSLYAGTKLNSEQYIKEHLDDYFIFRLGTLFGISSEHARIRCDLVANILTFKAVEGQALTIFGGEQWRPLLSVRDAAWTFADAIIHKHNPGTYIVSNENVKISDLAQRIVDVVSIWNKGDVQITTTDMKFEDLRNYKVDNSKALEEGFVPIIPLDMAIAEMRDIVCEGRIADVWNSRFHNARHVAGTN